VLVGMLGILLLLGCFLDQVSMMLVTLPFYMPLVQHFGFDPLWFGVMFLICMQMGLLLPPHGMLLMTMKGVAPPGVTMGHIFWAVTPFLVMSILMLVLVFFVPAVAVWLPHLLG
jgi:TRAP-type C4-dicarboxylate transport system permease large subunit